MMTYLRRLTGMTGALAATLSIASAGTAAATTVNTSQCGNPLLSEPFASVGDLNRYTLLGGQTPDNFNGAGWTLTGGAKIVSTPLADGTTGQVLDLPSGSQAVSPSICVTSNYPTARTEVRDLGGSDGVFFYVGYEGTSTWTSPRNTGQFHGNNNHAWTLTGNINLQPAGGSGWQVARFTYVPGGAGNEYQLYNFYVDPRMMR